MAEFPALPLWTDAYLGDTTHLTTTEHGAYMLLLMTAWRSPDCRLPDDDRLLARYTRLNSGQWKRVRPILQAFFRVENGFWTQGRLTDERDTVKRHRLLQSNEGKAGAAAKSLKTKGRHQAGVTLCLDPVEPLDQPKTCSLTLTHTTIPLDKSSGAVLPIFDKAADTSDQGGYEHDGEVAVAAQVADTAQTAGVDNSDVIFWKTAKEFLEAEISKSQAGGLIGAWIKKYGKGAVASALGRAQSERPFQRIPFIIGTLKKNAETATKSSWNGMA